MKRVLPAILLFTAALYLRSLFGSGFGDDYAAMLMDPSILKASSPLDFFLPGGPHSRAWPVTYTAYWSLSRLFGEAILPYKILNLLIHLLNITILWRLLGTLRVRYAWFVTALFAIHPVQVESVAWANQLKTTLSALFFLLSCLLVVTPARLPWRGRVWIPAFFFLLSIGTKSMTLTLFPIPLYLAWNAGLLKFSKPARWAALVIAALILIVTSAAGWRAVRGNSASYNEALRNQAQNPVETRSETVRILTQGSWSERALLIPSTLGAYEKLILAPWGNLHVYPNPASRIPFTALFLISVGLVLWAWSRRHQPELLLGTALFLLALIPVSGAVYVSFFKQAPWVDRAAYLAVPGLGLVLAGLASRLSEKGVRWNAGIPVALIVFLGVAWVGGRAHAERFADVPRLIENSLSKSPHSIYLHELLLQRHARNGEETAARDILVKLIQMNPAKTETYEKWLRILESKEGCEGLEKEGK